MNSIKKQKRISFFCFGIILILLFYISYLKENPEIKEVVVEREVITEVEKEIISEVYIEVEPEYYYNITSEEREMIARILYCEGNTCNLECQKMIVSVIFNRYEASNRQTSIKNIIYAKNQFTPVNKLNNTTPTEENYKAVDYIIKNGSILPSYVKYFRADYHFNWSGYIGYTSEDNVYFGYLEKDKIN